MQLNKNKQLIKKKQNYYLISIKTKTWYKNSHSLFDYQSSKITSNTFYFTTNTQSISIYRKYPQRNQFNQNSQLLAYQTTQIGTINLQQYQFLTKFQVKPTRNNKYQLHFQNDTDKEISCQKLNTEDSNGGFQKNEETYLIVGKQIDANGSPKGYKLQSGQTIRIGRVKFFISEVCIGNTVVAKGGRDKLKLGKFAMKYDPKNKNNDSEKRSCRICLDDYEQKDNFLFNPCKCSGSCGTLHLACLLQWITMKVKKQVVGGTLHYNFQQFTCEICKSQLPLIIETAENKLLQLLPIQRPKGNYLILEGACEKSKSVMVINNVPIGGIKLGRGRECQIRITDISISRNHALIKYKNEGFYIFDNRSKFGTLVTKEGLNVQIGGSNQQAIQIGRTIAILQIIKEDEINFGNMIENQNDNKFFKQGYSKY